MEWFAGFIIAGVAPILLIDYLTIKGFFRRWHEVRVERAAKRAQEAASRTETLNLFEIFLRETEPLVPQVSKYPKAALYRHAWKRAAILEIIYQRRSNQILVAQFQAFEKIAAERYFEAAPAGLYGKAALKMAEKTGIRLLEFELQRLFPAEERQPRFRPLACIYIAMCEEGRFYVGQTIGSPENRWVQHRMGGTGPFKKGALYVEWKVVEGEIDPAKLDEREAYYIGFYNAYEGGYNDTKGNDWKAYERGRVERNK